VCSLDYNGEPGAGYDTDSRWDTIDISRRVLAVARTITSVNRLLDVLPVIATDTRIQVLFTLEDGSQFQDGAADRVRDAGFRVIPWAHALRARFNLAVSASDKGRLVLPGHHPISGLAPAAIDTNGQVTPVAVAHPRQLDQLRTVSAPAAQRAVVVGDTCLDRRDNGSVRFTNRSGGGGIWRGSASGAGALPKLITPTLPACTTFPADPDMSFRTTVPALPVQRHSHASFECGSPYATPHPAQRSRAAFVRMAHGQPGSAHFRISHRIR
jgi:hypothetical protein